MKPRLLLGPALALMLMATHSAWAIPCNWNLSRSNWNGCELNKQEVRLRAGLDYRFHHVVFRGGRLVGDFSTMDLNTVTFEASGDSLGDQVDLSDAIFSNRQWPKIELNGHSVFSGKPQILSADQSGLGSLDGDTGAQYPSRRDHQPPVASNTMPDKVASFRPAARSGAAGSEPGIPAMPIGLLLILAIFISVLVRLRLSSKGRGNRLI